jgi:hypothetical protein
LLALFQSFLAGNASFFFESLIAGSLLGAFGAAMYLLGQWGGADAELLAAIGFLLPRGVENLKLYFPFPLSYLLNIFLIGAFYILVYIFLYSIFNKKVFIRFSEEVKAISKILVAGLIGVFFVLVMSINFLLPVKVIETISISSIFVAVFCSLFLLLKFAKIVEVVGFKKKIHVSKLRVGDVLEEDKFWRGINEKKLQEIKQSGKKFVRIKSGVRFAPVFFISLIFTLWIGDGILVFTKLLA